MFPVFHFKSLNIQDLLTNILSARSKTRKPQKSRKSRKNFSKNFKSEFSILAVGQNRKLGIITPRFPRFPTFPSFPSFQFAVFSFFKKYFFQYSKVRKQPLIHVLENTCS